MDIGIPSEERAAVIEHLNVLLADTYTLYLKTHNFHWNVTGPHFNTLHTMFEEHYNEMWLLSGHSGIRSLSYVTYIFTA